MITEAHRLMNLSQPITATAIRTLCCGDVAVDRHLRCRSLIVKTTLFRSFSHAKVCLDTQNRPQMVIFDQCIDHCLDTSRIPYAFSRQSRILQRYVPKVAHINILQNTVAARFAVCGNFAGSQTANHIIK